MTDTYVLVLGDQIGEQRLINLNIVALLLQGKAIDLTGFPRGRLIVRVHLEDTILSALLLAKNLKSSFLIVRSNDTVGNLTGNNLGSRNIDFIGKSNPITK